MTARHLLRRSLTALALTLTFAPPLAAVSAGPAAAATLTTAWQNGAFSENVGGMVSRSDVVLGEPNSAPSQSLPLGNGSLGVAAWAANGFTAQLNRSDTMPDRLSPGQVQIPGLAAMTSAANFSGYLDLYDGVLHESGGGITMNAWVPEGKDELIVDVAGVSPAAQQTATLNLWSGRSPSATAAGAYGSLAQTWVDNTQTGSSGATFGAMATITAGGQNVAASVVNSTTVQVAFTADSSGDFRVVVAAPEWTGGNAVSTATSLIGSDATAAASTLLAAQSSWWNSFWANSGLIEASSADGSAQYMENLRTLYLYDEAASMKSGAYPGSQAGVADMFAYDEDQQDWYPAGYWLWNLRGQIAANLSSGNYALNVPIFNMYLNDLPAIESWTSAQMGGLPGACIPETMRFNGNGYYNGGSNSQNASCATASSPSYNAEDITSGAELAMWIWQQYQDTGSTAFLKTYYPILEQTATFLLAYQKAGSDGFLHATANAHETQWAVTDPTTDIAADQALFPAVVQAATLLGTDSALVSQLKTAETQIEPYARASQSNLATLLNSQPTTASAVASLDAAGNDVIADSYQPAAALENSENIGLEPVWPWGQIGDNTTVNGDNLTALADRTYNSRPNGTNAADWSFDAVDAARLDMPSQVASDLTAITENYQAFISGMANLFNGSVGDEPYIEQQSTVATAMDEALATDYDGTIRFAPAWPSGWTASGTVYIQGGSKLDVQVESGTLATAAIQAGTTATLTVRNPWSGQQAEVVNGSTGAVVVAATTATTLSVPVTAGSTYLVEQPSNLTTSLTFAQVTGTQATTYKTLGGKVQIGLPGKVVYPSLAASFNDVGITADNNTAPGNWDGNGSSFSQTALTNAGAGPGATVSTGGIGYAMPDVGAGAADNTVAEGQTIDLAGSGTSLGFLLAASYGPAAGTATITYSDGSTQNVTLNAPDWFSTSAPSGGTVAVNSSYLNNPGNTPYSHTADIFAESFPLTAGKTVASVTLPSGGALTSGTPALHILGLAFGGAGGGGGTASLTASPTSLSFGAQAENTGSASQTTTITDNGSAAASISSITTPSGFAQTDTCGSSLAAGASCSISVTFQPSAAQAYNGNLTINSNATDGTLNVALSGTGTGGGGSPVNLALGQPITASSTASGYPATNADDGNTSSYWEGGAGTWPAALTVDLGSSDALNSVVIDLPPSSAWQTRTQTLAVLGSNDGSSWSTLVGSATYTWNPSTGNTVTVALPGGTTDRYVQLSFTANNAQNAAQASEIQVLGTGSANLASNRPATASSTTSGFPPSNADDGNTSSYWQGGTGTWPSTLSVDLGSTQPLGSLVIDLPPSSAWQTRTQTLAVLGSNDGSSWSTLVGSATYTWNPSTGNTVTVALPSGTSDRYVELSFTANNVQNAAQVAEIQIYG